MSRYDDYVYVHMQAMLIFTIDDRTKPIRNGNWTLRSDMRMPMWAHRCPAFLPWHRELLRQFERVLQCAATDSNLALSAGIRSSLLSRNLVRSCHVIRAPAVSGDK